MAETKIGIWVLNIVGPVFLVWGIIIPFDGIKSVALLVVGLAFAWFRLYNLHLDAKKKDLIWRNTKENIIIENCKRN